MGIYLNPGNEGFEESIRSKIYVDKTGLIACTNQLLNTEEKFVCVSRPLKIPTHRGARLYDGHPSREEVRVAFGVEHVLGIFDDEPGYI